MGISTDRQLKPETAFIYRRGLAKTDLTKDTINVKIQNTVTLGAKGSESSRGSGQNVPSLSSLLSDLISYGKKQTDKAPLQESLDLNAEDSLQSLRKTIATNSQKECIAAIPQAIKFA